MNQASIVPSNTLLMVISDVHLKSLSDDIGELFLQLLAAAEKSKPEYLILLGDIFDFTLGSNRYYRKKYQKISAQFQKLVSAGVNVIFVEGNHEFRLSHHGWTGVVVTSNFKYSFELSNGEQISVTHGDGICSPRRYHIFRKIVRSKLFLYPFQYVPGKFLDAFALKFSEASRNQDENRKVDHTRIFDLADRWFYEESPEYGIFGHFHEPFAINSQNKKTKLLCLQNWQTTPNALIYDGSSFHRHFYTMSEEKINLTKISKVEFHQPD